MNEFYPPQMRWVMIMEEHMTYVMSDIHGCYDKYIKMLEKINFNKNDVLYILGDVVDRGAEPIRVLKDMMMRDNVIPIIGNHEVLAIECLDKLLTDITEDNFKTLLDNDSIAEVNLWIVNGGIPTIKGLTELPNNERNYIYEYLTEFSLYEKVVVGGKKYILTHCGLPRGASINNLNKYNQYQFINAVIDYDKKYFDYIYLVHGHLPTRHIDISYKDKAYIKNNHIAIDTGAVFGGPLCCVCLDNHKEFYV